MCGRFDSHGCRPALTWCKVSPLSLPPFPPYPRGRSHRNRIRLSCGRSASLVGAKVASKACLETVTRLARRPHHEARIVLAFACLGPVVAQLVLVDTARHVWWSRRHMLDANHLSFVQISDVNPVHVQGRGYGIADALHMHGNTCMVTRAWQHMVTRAW
eukprot:353404-Chlamydomonas_euryale.AAC.16